MPDSVSLDVLSQNPGIQPVSDLKVIYAAEGGCYFLLGHGYHHSHKHHHA